jgi:predicted Zn-dependent protease
MPETLGRKFVDKLRNDHGVVPDRAESVNLNGMPAYLISVQDNSSGEVIDIHSLWFRLNEVTFQLLGVAKVSNGELLRNTALSIRNLTNKERSSIHMHTLRVRNARAGESIAEFNTRTGNVWNAEITAIMNNIDQDEVLDDGQLMKIAIREPYRE